MKKLECYDDIIIVYKDGTEKRYSINVSTFEGVNKRDKILERARKSKKVRTVDLRINSKIEMVEIN